MGFLFEQSMHTCSETEKSQVGLVAVLLLLLSNVPAAVRPRTDLVFRLGPKLLEDRVPIHSCNEERNLKNRCN